jgi:predicted dehydrogenase
MVPLRIGLLGAGRIAQSAHLPAMGRATDVTLVCLHDPSAVLTAEVASRYRVPGCASVGEVLQRDDVDAVLVATPDRTHLELASAALAAGKHVLVEKPMTATVSEAEELADRVRASGLVLQVGAMKRHDPGVRYAATAAERLGPVLSASIWYRVMSAARSAVEANHAPSMVVDDAVRRSERAFKEDATRYLLTTHGAHVFDTLRFLLGEPVDVSARYAQVGDDRTWHVEASLADGGLAHVEISASVHGGWDEGAVIHGERGTLRLRTHFPLLLVSSDVEVFTESAGRSERPSHPAGNAYQRQLEAFARSVLTGSPSEPDVQDGLRAVRLIETVERSMAGGGLRVRVP